MMVFLLNHTISLYNFRINMKKKTFSVLNVLFFQVASQRSIRKQGLLISVCLLFKWYSAKNIIELMSSYFWEKAYLEKNQILVTALSESGWNVRHEVRKPFLIYSAKSLHITYFFPFANGKPSIIRAVIKFFRRP